MNLTVITSYPQRNNIHGEQTVGVASYTKNTLLTLKKMRPELKIKVLADILTDEGEYEEENIQVKRLWRRKNLKDVFRLFSQIPSQQEGPLIVAFEAYMFGGLFYTGIFLLELMILRALGKKIYLILHQVVDDFSPLEKNPIKRLLLNVLSSMFYRALLLSSFKTIVFEERLKTSLKNNKKIVVIPHAVEAWQEIDQATARKKLGLVPDTFYVLYFGFLSPYKGVEELIEIWDIQQSNQLIIAGGGNPQHMNEPLYRNSVEGLEKKAAAKGIEVTGFVPEVKITLYYAASDLVILPYKLFMSSSGPLSFAFWFEKPVLLSKPLEGYFETEDFKKALSKLSLEKENILFKFDSQDLLRKIEWAKENKSLLANFSSLMRDYRSWNEIGKKYLDLLMSSSRKRGSKRFSI